MSGSPAPEKLTLEQLRTFIPRMPFNMMMGMRIDRVHDDGVTISCAVIPKLLDGDGALHGGVLTSLADAAAGLATQRHLGGRRPITTVELKMNHVRPVKSGRVSVRARLLRVGNTLSIARVDITAARKPAGVALVTYMLLPPVERPANTPPGPLPPRE